MKTIVTAPNPYSINAAWLAIRDCQKLTNQIQKLIVAMIIREYREVIYKKSGP